MTEPGLPVTRIAMWSGPRNISTAMMRAWENRPDANVVDEPFYACYLTATGIQHPMQEEVLASQSSDWQEVIQQQLDCPLPKGITVQYQKHMTQHMVADIDQSWFRTLRHAFLIRHPAEVVASYTEKRGSVSAEDIGFAQQQRLYQLAGKLCGSDLPIIDAKDVLTDPGRILNKLCERLGVPFYQQMLHWPAGIRDSDGVWAAHWYNQVEKSTGFGQYRKRNISLDRRQQQVVDECMPFYEHMHEHRIRVS